jgi:hypothetical protein
MTTGDVRGCLEAALAGTRGRLRKAGVHLSDWGLRERPREWTLWLECRSGGTSRSGGPSRSGGTMRGDAPVWRAAATWPRSPRAGRRHALAALAQALSEVALASGRGVSLWREEGAEPSRPAPAPLRRARAPSRRCG